MADARAKTGQTQRKEHQMMAKEAKVNLEEYLSFIYLRLALNSLSGVGLQLYTHTFITPNTEEILRKTKYRPIFPLKIKEKHSLNF